MSTLAQAPPSRGLEHLGLLYDEVDDMVARAVPEVRAVLDAGGDVHVTMERRGVRGMREALGADAERVSFPSPSADRERGAPDYLADLRRRVRRGRRTLVVGQYSHHRHETWDPRYAEDAVNLVLADLPLTVLCACASESDHRPLAERSHRQLVDGQGKRADNPAWVPPPSSSPAPMAPWGAPIATMTVHGAHTLAAVRHKVAEIATVAGLDRDAGQAAVLAAHEAVLLAGTAARPEVRVRAWGSAVLTEVLAARSPAPGPVSDDEWSQGTQADYLPHFCDRMSLHDGPGGRLVRVLNS